MSRITNSLVKPINKTPYGSGSYSGFGSFDSLLGGTSGGSSGNTPYNAGTPGRGANPQAMGFTQQGPGVGPFRAWYAPGQAPGRTNTTGTSGTLLGGARGALGHDINNLEDANAFNTSRELSAADRLGRVIDTQTGNIVDAGDRAAGLLMDAAGQPLALGRQQVDDFYGRANSILGNLEDTTAANASAMSRGMSRDFDIRSKLASKGFDENGQPLTSAQQADQQYGFAREEGQQKQQAFTQLFSDFNNTRANLAAQLESIGTSVLGGQRDMSSLAANLKSTAAQVQNAAVQSAAQFELGGQSQLANYIQSTPFSPVSWFSGLSALFNMASAPGARNVRL